MENWQIQLPTKRWWLGLKKSFCLGCPGYVALKQQGF